MPSRFRVPLAERNRQNFGGNRGDDPHGERHHAFPGDHPDKVSVLELEASGPLGVHLRPGVPVQAGMQPEHLLQEGQAGPVTGHVHERGKGDQEKGVGAIGSPDSVFEPKVGRLGAFFPSLHRSGEHGLLQQGRHAGIGRKEERSPIPVHRRMFPRVPPSPFFLEQTPEVLEGRIAVYLPAAFAQILQELQGNRLEERRPLPRGEDLLHPRLYVPSIRCSVASRVQVDARLPSEAQEYVPEGTRARHRGDDRLLQAQLGKGKIRGRQRQVRLLQIRGHRKHDIGKGRGVIDHRGALDHERNSGKPILPRLPVRREEHRVDLGDQKHFEVGDFPGRCKIRESLRDPGRGQVGTEGVLRLAGKSGRTGAESGDGGRSPGDRRRLAPQPFRGETAGQGV